jgi:hypothetical protein
MRPAWVTRGIAQLIRQFCSRGGNTAWIGVGSDQPLRGRQAMPGSGPMRDGGRIELMPNMPLSDGLVWLPNGGADDPELWLSPTKKGYRDAFDRFSRRYLGATGLDTANVQIDHVFPKKAGVMGGLAYVRMLAIPPESNMAAGRTLERAMVARNEDLGPRGKATRMATYFAVGKAAGFVGYEQMPDDEASQPNSDLASALMTHLRGFGLPADVLTALDQRLTAGRLESFR